MPDHQVIHSEQVNGLKDVTVWPSHRENADSQASVKPDRSITKTTRRVRKSKSVYGFINSIAAGTRPCGYFLCSLNLRRTSSNNSCEDDGYASILLSSSRIYFSVMMCSS